MFKNCLLAFGLCLMGSVNCFSDDGFEYDADDGYSCYMAAGPLTTKCLEKLDTRTTALDLSESDISDDDLNALGDHLGTLDMLDSIKTLDIRRNSFTSEALKDIAKITSLEDLNMSYVGLNGQTDFTSFSALTSLSTLDISCNSLKDVGVAALCQTLPHLEILNIEACDMTANSLSALKKMKALKKLSMTSDGVDEGVLSDFLGYAQDNGIEAKVSKVFK